LVWTVLPWANGADELVEAAGFMGCCDVVAEGGGVIVGVAHCDEGAGGVWEWIVRVD
jgi:glutamate dehydrogenase/leucine dehydrogenase